MDDVKGKREARRRKILENSEKRLQKITRCKLEEREQENVISDTNEVKKSVMIEVTSIYKPPVVSLNSNYVEREDENKDRLPSPVDYTPTLTTPQDTSMKRNDNKIWKKLGFKLVILAIVVRIIHIFKLGYLFGETIVIPFALFMMTQLGSYHFDQNVAGITGPILFFIGMSPSRIKNLLICYNVVTSILVYFGIYFFTFVCVHLTFVTVLGL